MAVYSARGGGEIEMGNDNYADTPNEISIYWLQPWTWIEDDNHGSNYLPSPKIEWNDIKKLINE